MEDENYNLMDRMRLAALSPAPYVPLLSDLGPVGNKHYMDQLRADVKHLNVHEMGSVEMQLAGYLPLPKYEPAPMAIGVPPVWDLESWRAACEKAMQSFDRLFYEGMILNLADCLPPHCARNMLRTDRRNHRRRPKTRTPFIKSPISIHYAHKNR